MPSLPQLKSDLEHGHADLCLKEWNALRELKPWEDLYYTNFTYLSSPKALSRFDKLVAVAPEALAKQILECKAKTEKAIEAVKAAVAAEKAEKAARKATRAANAANTTPSGVKLGKVCKEAYETLSACFVEERKDFVAQSAAAYRKAYKQFRSLYEAAPDREAKLQVFRSFGSIAAAVMVQGYFPKDIETTIVKLSEDHAQREFDSYLVKLAGKINAPIAKAYMTGNLWNGSTLTVITKMAEQVWSTKCILNVSVLGNPFHQWPTTRVL